MPRIRHPQYQIAAKRSSYFKGSLKRLLLIVLMGVCPAQTLLKAEDESGQLTFPDESTTSTSSSGSLATRPLKNANGPGAGMDGRIGFIGLPTLGREDSIVPIEIFPYVQTDNQIFFGDFRGFLTTNGKVGANFGVGYRVIEPNDFALFGVNGFYDVDGSLGRTFQQLSVGFEARTEMIGMYGNVYLPVGDKNKTLQQSVFNERFDGNQILFDVRSRTGQAMSGLDLNLQAFLPGDFSRDHQVQATAGWYSFNGSGVEDINGFHLQLQGDVTPSVTLLASYTNDRTFGSNIAIGGMFRFGTRDRPDTSLQGQLRRFVHRNYNVIVSTKNVVDSGIVAINPETGNAYVVHHVGTPNGSPNGEYDSPFDNVGDAQNGADIIFVHEGKTINEQIQLADGQSLFGEGSNVTLTDATYGNFRLPGGSSSSPTSPAIIDGTGIIGDLITLGNNSRISGFKVKNAQGNAIVADGLDDFQITNIDIENSVGDSIVITDVKKGQVSNVSINGGTNGISLIDIDGTVSLSNIYLEDTAGHGIFIDGGLGRIAFTDQLIVKDSGLSAFYVTNLETLVEVDDKGTATTSDDVTTKTPAIVTVDQLVVRNTTGGNGIHLENNEGVVAFGAIDIETTNGNAIYARDSENIQVFNGFLKTQGAAAIDIEGSGINMSLTKLEASGGTNGVRFVDTTGILTVYGSGALGSGGSIKNTTDAIFMKDGPLVAMQTVDFTNNGTVAKIDGADGLILAGSNITQTSNMFVDAKNLTMLQISDTQFTNNTITSGVGIRLQVDEVGSYTSSITYNNVDSLPGTFLRIETLTGGEGSTLATNFQGNNVTLGAANSSAASINWTGTTTAYFLQNLITGTAAGQTGFQFHTGASNDQATATVYQNKFVMGGANGTAVDIDVRSMSTIQIVSNEIIFNGLNGTGVLANLRKASGVNVSSNSIVDNAGGATGIHFENVEHLSTLMLNANNINLSYASMFVDRGIVLSNLLNPDAVATPFVTFISTESNTITGATTPYSLPATGARGTLLINNTSAQ